MGVRGLVGKGRGSNIEALYLLDDPVRMLVERMGWKTLTDAQAKAIPLILDGYNVVIMAPTGGGKTEAAMLPVLSILTRENPEPVAVLYITPMKALINDLYERIRRLAEPLGLRVARKHGDTPARERSKRHRAVPHILITTPESLEIDLDWAPKFRRYYENLRFVVVDEVHELLSSKRGAQLVLLLERLRRGLAKRDFQVIGLSATIGDPRRVLDLLSGSSRRPRAVVASDSRKTVELRVEHLEYRGDPWSPLAERIAEIARSTRPILVFVNSRFAAEQVKNALEELGVEDVLVHHSSVSAELREEAEEMLKRGEIAAIVCTKTLEVGIDVGRIKLVVQVRSPGTVASLLQRVGRSGHTIEGTPRGTILTVDDYDFMESVAIARLAALGRVEDIAIKRLPLDVVARQILGMILADKEVPFSKVREILEGLSNVIEVDLEALEDLIEYMAKNKVLRIEERNGERILRLGPTFYKIWKFRGDKGQKAWWSRSFAEFFSTITERDVFTVKYGEKTIGYIDSLFVYRHLRVGDTIRLAGTSWKVKRIDENLSRVLVEPTKAQAEVPLWRGEGPRRARIVAESLSEILAGEDLAGVEIDDRGRSVIEAWRKSYSQIEPPRPHHIIYERYGDEHIFTTMLGSGANEALAIAISHLASKKIGLSTRYRAGFAGFSVYVGDLNPLELLTSINPDSLYDIIMAALDKSPYLYQVIREIQLSFGKIGSVDYEGEDEILIEEAKKQVVEEYLDLDTAKWFLELLRTGRIRVKTPLIGGLTPLAKSIVQQPSIRPWLPDLAPRIARFLEGTPLTVIDLADALELAEKTIESKLKEMRKPEYGDLRVVSFIDIDTGETRWALLRELENIAESEDYRESFRPKRLGEPLRVYIRAAPGQKPREIILKPADLLGANTDRILSLFPREAYSIKVTSAYAMDTRDDVSVVHYHVPVNAVRYLLLNAARYLESKYYEEFF